MIFIKSKKNIQKKYHGRYYICLEDIKGDNFVFICDVINHPIHKKC